MQACISYTQYIARLCEHVMEKLSTGEDKHITCCCGTVCAVWDQWRSSVSTCLLFANLACLQHAHFSPWNAGVT